MRTKRPNHLCVNCGVLGDERHAIYHCNNIDRSNILLPDTLNEIWTVESIFLPFRKFKDAKILD